MCGFFLLAACLALWDRLATASIVPCLSTREFPNRNITNVTMPQAIQACREAGSKRNDGMVQLHLLRDPPETPDDYIVKYEPDRAMRGARLGNWVLCFATAVGLSSLAGIPFLQCNFTYDGMPFAYIQTHSPRARRHGAFSTRAALLRHLCQRCPYGAEFPHTCPGLWTVANISEVLRRAVIDEAIRLDVVVQYRCEPKEPAMGFLPLQYYLDALTGRVQPTSRVHIILDVTGKQSSCCAKVASALKESLKQAFGCEVVVRPSRSLRQDLSDMLQARIFVGSASTLGLTVALGSRTDAYLPLIDLLAGRTRPCLPHLHWVDTTIYHGSCSDPSLRWFYLNQKQPA